MKTSILFLLAILTTLNVYSQRAAFRTVSVQGEQDAQTLQFSTPSEVNVRHYRIEASNDNVDFDIIATVPSKGNSMLPVHYNYDLSAFSYTYYRIGKVAMDGAMPYSATVCTKKAVPCEEQPVNEVPPVITANILMHK